MERIQNQLGSIEQVQNQYLGKNSRPVSGPSDQVTSFTDILSEKFGIQTESNQSIRFSKHATERLYDRNITLTKVKKMHSFKNGMTFQNCVMISSHLQVAVH